MNVFISVFLSGVFIFFSASRNVSVAARVSSWAAILKKIPFSSGLNSERETAGRIFTIPSTSARDENEYVIHTFALLDQNKY